jgi:replicative DNA helicase
VIASEWRRYTDIVARHALSRRIIWTASEMREAALAGRNEAARRAAGDLLAEAPVGGRPEGLMLGEELLAIEAEHPTPWVIPGLLRQAWRAMLVGVEGYGKSSVMYQLAVAAAYGTHPFNYEPIEAVPTLVLDFENDDADVRTMTGDMVETLQGKGLGSAGWHVWRPRRPVDLRRPTTRREIESILRQVRPALVCLGPLYRAYRRTAKESDEDAAAEVQPVLDDWRSRYGFALVIEHHAPKAGGQRVRELDPFGSSLWMRWPDLGYRLVPLDERDRVVRDRTGRLGVWDFRGARKMAAWPSKLDWTGTPYPWIGTWPSGYRGGDPRQEEF